MDNPLFLTLADDSWQRAHYAFVIAAGALSVGRSVTLFAGGKSVHALAYDWSKLSGIIPDDELADKGVAGFEELRESVVLLGAELIACEAGMSMVGLSSGNLLENVSIKGIVTFLEMAKNHSILAL